jgi:hypothetical protein
LVRLEICRSGVVVENRVFDSARGELGLVRLGLPGGGGLAVGGWQLAEDEMYSFFEMHQFFLNRHSERIREESGLCVEGCCICGRIREGKGLRRIGQMLHEYIQHDDFYWFQSVPKNGYAR